jgi:hypothetical protein
MTAPAFMITEARLKALSPVARKIAEDAIRWGFWQLIKEDTSISPGK